MTDFFRQADSAKVMLAKPMQMPHPLQAKPQVVLQKETEKYDFPFRYRDCRR